MAAPPAFQPPNLTVHYAPKIDMGTATVHPPAPQVGQVNPSAQGQPAASPGISGPASPAMNNQVRDALVSQLAGHAAPSAPQAPGAGSVLPPAPGAAPAAQGTAPALPATLGANPAYNAFLASLGLTDADLRNAATLRTNTINNGLQAGIEGLDRAQQGALVRTGNIYAGRGLENSSDNLNAQAGVRSAYQGREAASREAAANQIANIGTNLALALAKGQQSASTAGLNSLGNQDIAAALASANNPFASAVTG